MLVRAAWTTGIVSLVVASGCSSAPSSVDSTEAAASINVSNAKVAICDDEEGGCPKCDEKIGDYALTADERDACTLKALRGALKDRVNVLIAQAGRQGLFLRTAGGEAPIRLARIKVIPDVAGVQNAKSQYTRLSGSFTAGESADSTAVKGGVSVYSEYVPVRIVFEFEDKSGELLRQEPFAMHNTYHIVPFFYMKAELAVNLNIGSVMSKFGAGPVASALLSALGGESSLHVDAAHEVRWTTPVCADSTNDDSAERSLTKKTPLSVFDKDFMKNVLVPVCLQYKKDNGADVRCSLDERGADFSTATLLERSSALASRKILAAESCVMAKDAWGPMNTYAISFVAPALWGFAEGQEAFLYKRSATARDFWSDPIDMQVVGVDGQKCGARVLGGDEVCVHAQVRRAAFQLECASIAREGPRNYGASQNNGEETDRTIQYALDRE